MGLVAGIWSIAVVAIAIIIIHGVWKRREEWRRDYWGECYQCWRVGLVAGWRSLRVGKLGSASPYAAAAVCASCRQWRELRAAQGPNRKVAFFETRIEAQALAEQMNDDVRDHGVRKVQYG